MADLVSSRTLKNSAGFHPVIELPKNYVIFDLTKGADPRNKPGVWGVGRYNEKRPGTYTAPLFGGNRNVHMGVDISGPPGTPIYAFEEGTIFMTEYRPALGDYGATLITKHLISRRPLYVLWGHLQKRSIEGKAPGQRFHQGQAIAWIGDEKENGGWTSPHLHLQISYEKPLICDMPGAVAEQDLPKALRKYPDPRIILGDLY